MNNKKILGIDYGDFTIGLAIFDLSLDFIYPYKTIFRDKENILRKSLREIIDIVKNEKITDIVIGLPLNFDGTEGERIDKVKHFKKMLETKLNAVDLKKDYEYSIDIHFQDERLSTKEAREILRNHGVKKENEKKIIDQVAAEIILQDFKSVYLKNRL